MLAAAGWLDDSRAIHKSSHVYIHIYIYEDQEVRRASGSALLEHTTSNALHAPGPVQVLLSDGVLLDSLWADSPNCGTLKTSTWYLRLSMGSFCLKLSDWMQRSHHALVSLSLGFPNLLS